MGGVGRVATVDDEAIADPRMSKKRSARKQGCHLETRGGARAQAHLAALAPFASCETPFSFPQEIVDFGGSKSICWSAQAICDHWSKLKHGDHHRKAITRRNAEQNLTRFLFCFSPNFRPSTLRYSRHQTQSWPQVDIRLSTSIRTIFRIIRPRSSSADSQQIWRPLPLPSTPRATSVSTASPARSSASS